MPLHYLSSGDDESNAPSAYEPDFNGRNICDRLYKLNAYRFVCFIFCAVYISTTLQCGQWGQ